MVPVFLWMRLDLVFLVVRTTSGGVFWGVCDLIMILVSLSGNEWGCVPVLLVVWHGVSSTIACWSLSAVGSWHWDGDVWESSHRLILCGVGRSLVVQCPELGSPTSEAQAWHLAKAPKPCQPHGLSMWLWTSDLTSLCLSVCFLIYRLVFGRDALQLYFERYTVVNIPGTGSDLTTKTNYIFIWCSNEKSYEYIDSIALSSVISEVCKPFGPSETWPLFFLKTNLLKHLRSYDNIAVIYTVTDSSANQLFAQPVKWVSWCLGLCWDLVRDVKSFLLRSAWERLENIRSQKWGQEGNTFR